MDFQLWSDTLLYPRDTFRAELEKASLKGAIKNIIIAGFIYGAVTGFLYDILPIFKELFLPGLLRELVQGYAMISSIFVSPLIFLFLVFLFSGIFYLASRTFNGYGSFVTQTYLLSTLAAPLIISGLFVMIPYIGQLMMLFLFLYALWPLSLALRETHRYRRRECASSLLLSGVLTLVVFFLATMMLLQLNFSVGSWGLIEKSNQGFTDIKVINSAINYNRQGYLEFELINTLNEEVIVAGLSLEGDCLAGKIDLDLNTKKEEHFIILPPDGSSQVRITDCQKKLMVKEFIRSKFSVPVKFSHQQKVIGKSAVTEEQGILEGMAEY